MNWIRYKQKPEITQNTAIQIRKNRSFDIAITLISLGAVK